MEKPFGREEIIKFFNELLGKNEIIDRYQHNKISFETLEEVSNFFIKNKELLKQTFYFSYSEQLIVNAESERGRDYWK